MLQKLTDTFSQHRHLVELTAEKLAGKIVTMADLMLACFASGGKILCCGNGGSACDAEHFVAEMVNRFQVERVNLPAIALAATAATMTAIANDYNFNEVFAKQINAYGNSGDLLLAISTSGNSSNILRAVESAHAKNLRVIALTGDSGGKLAAQLGADDLVLQVPSANTPRIQEMHILIIHAVCELIDVNLAPPNSDKKC